MSEGLQSFPSSHRTSTVICWVLILASVGYVATRVYTQKERGLAKTDDFQLELTARMLVGQKLMTENIGQQTPPTSESMRAIESTEASPQQKIRLAILAGELAGAQDAIKRLQVLQSAATTKPLLNDVQTLEKIYAGKRESVASDERDALIDRHDWFGKLALVYGLPDDHPERADVVVPAQHAVWVGVTAVLGIIVLVFAGLVLLIIAIVLLAKGTIRPMFAPVVIANAAPVFLEAFAIYITSFVLFGEILRRVMPGMALVGILFTTLLLPLALIWPMLRGATRRESLLGFGWHRGRGILTEMVCGVGGYVAGLPLIALGLVVTIALSKFAAASPAHPIMNELRGSRAMLAMIYVLACIWAPVMEETMFRGALYNHLRGSGKWLTSWIRSSLVVGVLFALVHPQGWTAIPALGAIGAVLASVREWRGSLIGPVTAHALNNGTAITIVVLLLR